MQKNNGYLEFLATIGDWVYYDCPVMHAFSEDDCACVLTGTNASMKRKILFAKYYLYVKIKIPKNTANFLNSSSVKI